MINHIQLINFNIWTRDENMMDTADLIIATNNNITYYYLLSIYKNCLKARQLAKYMSLL